MRSLPFAASRRACRVLLPPAVMTVVVVAALYGTSAGLLDWASPAATAPAEAAAVAAPSAATPSDPAATAQPASPSVPPATAPPAGAARPAAAPQKQTTCDPAPTMPVPSMVGAIFRCRLTEAGFAPEHVEAVTAEAVAIAACESEFDPNAIVFEGRYVDRAHPATGSRYSAAGIFQFIRDRADRWIDGGYANATDPAANIDAAARVYLHNVRRGYPGWSDWACAAANDGFRETSVLPGWPGGPPALPEWAYRF